MSNAFGNLLNQTGTVTNPYLYAGYRLDKETGLYYLQARYYDSKNGRFLTLDPDSGDIESPLTQNGYAYGDNNPVMNVDPDGYSARRIWYSLKYAVLYWLSQYVGWKAADRIAATVIAFITGLKAARSAYRTAFKGASSLAWKIPRRVFTYSTLKAARRIAIKAALRIGLRVAFVGA